MYMIATMNAEGEVYETPVIVIDQDEATAKANEVLETMRQKRFSQERKSQMKVSLFHLIEVGSEPLVKPEPRSSPPTSEEIAKLIDDQKNRRES
jgi:hypothetical protein